jgi:hypothetical protein
MAISACHRKRRRQAKAWLAKWRRGWRENRRRRQYDMALAGEETENLVCAMGLWNIEMAKKQS